MITLFSWGYWGWGSATEKLVHAVDTVEAARGFAPPLFVDIRISRSVRAPGFRDHAFEGLVGKKRYVWMKELGNKRIESRTGPAIQIAHPEAAKELLELARQAATRSQRVIFFCACATPRAEDTVNCHRWEVAKLLRDAAFNAGVDVRTVEWPNGPLEVIDLQVSRATFQAVRNRKNVPLPEPVELARFGGLPWGSIVRLHAGKENAQFVSGPAVVQGEQWCLPKLDEILEGESEIEAGQRFRKTWGYEPQESGRKLAEACIYTIAHVDKLRAIVKKSGTGTLTEGTLWSSGRKLLEKSRAEGQHLPLVFADAKDCSRLIYWGILTDITIRSGETQYSFEHLRELGGEHAPQDLVLLSTRKTIAPKYIRPYALCETPKFLQRRTKKR